MLDPLRLKFERNVSLADAHEVAERAESAIRSEPEVDDAHAHLESLEQPVAALEEAGRYDLRLAGKELRLHGGR